MAWVRQYRLITITVYELPSGSQRFGLDVLGWYLLLGKQDPKQNSYSKPENPGKFRIWGLGGGLLL